MSTYRDISTLPLDALRSATSPIGTTGERYQPRTARREASRERDSGPSLASNAGMYRSQTGSILTTNQKLYDENRKLRRCLSLFLENSQLKTMNVLSTAMSVCDDKLRNFMTEKLTCEHPPTRDTTADFTAQTFNQQNNERISSPTYGKSFAKLGLNDLRNSTFNGSNLYTKEKSPLRSYPAARASSPLRPPMRFGYGSSPYQQSPPKFPTDSSFSDKSNRTSEYRDQSKHRSRSRSQSRNKYSVKINTKEMQTQMNAPAGTYSQKNSLPKRPMSAPASPRKFITQNAEYVDTKIYKGRDSRAFSPVKSIRHCRSCGINLLPTCNCQIPMPKAVTGTEDSISTDRAQKYINDQPRFTDTKQGTSAGSNYETLQHSVYNSIPAHKEHSLHKNPSNYPSDLTGTVFKRHVSKTINFTQAPPDHPNKSQPNDDYVVEKFRREKKHYERILAAANESDDQSTQTTIAESDTIDGNHTTDEQHTTDGMDGTSVDVDPQDLYCSAFQKVKFEDGPQNKTPSRNKTEKQGESYGRIGAPIATSTPLPTPEKKLTFREGHTLGGDTRDKSSLFSSNRDQYIRNQAHDDFWPNNNTCYVCDAGTKLSSDTLADIMGITGRGSREKVNYVLHRPVDVLIGYTPDISDEASLSLAVSKPNKRIVGEIAFQLDRRILEFVFARTSDKHASKRRSRYYGYSVASIMVLINKEVRHAGNDSEVERTLTMRLELILENLLRFGYELERHSEFTQDMVNKYGLLNGAPDPDTVEGFGLNEPAVLRILLGQILKDAQELDDMLIILDCLHYMAHKDKRPLFGW